jgi:ABC-type phosphate transport system substrate-binding protein
MAVRVTGTLLSFVLLSPMVDAAVVVIGSHDIDPSAFSERTIENTVKNLYLGKTVQLDNGVRVEVVDLPNGSPVREEFYQKVIGKDTTQIRAYWAKRIFTGKGSPPETRLDEQAVVRWVKEAPGRIGYVSAEAVDGTVRVLMRTN